MRYYKAYNLVLGSEFALPTFFNALPEHSTPDVTISRGHINPNGIASPVEQGLFYQTTPTTFWLYVPSVAYFLVSDGQKIVVDAIDNNEDNLRAFLLNVCLSILLRQRKTLLFNAGAIQLGGCGIAILGMPSTGISTLLAVFLQQGYALLSDKICAIDIDNNIMTGLAQLELWPHAVHHLKIKTDTIKKFALALIKC